MAGLVYLSLGTSSAQAQTRDPLSPVPCRDLNWQFADPAFAALSGAKTYFGRYEGGTYRIEVPDNWNGELILWAHGARSDVGPQGHMVQNEMPGSTGGSARLREHWIRAGFAWAASTYRCNGAGPGLGLLDTLRLREVFAREHPSRAPSRLYLVGSSLGGGVVLRAMHLLPTTFAAGLAMCPVVAPARWDFAVAVAAAAEAISGMPIHETTSDADRTAALRTVLGTPKNYTTKGRQLASVQIELSGGPRPFAMEGLEASYEANIIAALNQRGGAEIRAATNRDTRYALDERFGLTAEALNSQVRRIAADDTLRGSASSFLEASALTGEIQRPVMTLHGTGDLQVPISSQRTLREIVVRAGKGDLLVQRIMRIPGHCRYSDEEQIQAFDDLVAWVKDGKRPEGDDVMGDLRDAGRKFTNPLRPGDPGTLSVGRP